MAKTFGTLTAPKSGPRARSKPNSAQSESRSLGGSIYASTVLSLDADGPHEEDQPLNDQQWVGRTFHVILTIRILLFITLRMLADFTKEENRVVKTNQKVFKYGESK